MAERLEGLGSSSGRSAKPSLLPNSRRESAHVSVLYFLMQNFDDFFSERGLVRWIRGKIKSVYV